MASITVGPNGRYFLDQDGNPFFWLGDTLWELFRAFAPADARRILEKRREQGFTVIQAMLTGFNDGKMANAAGETPWNGGDPASPNQSYFRNVDELLGRAGDLGLIVVLGVFHQLHRASITIEKARAYAGWVSARYAGLPHVVWTMYPEANASFLPIVRELAAGLREGDAGAHLITMHPDPSPASSSFAHDEPWLAFNQIQPWKHYELQHPMVLADYRRSPPKPVIMAEGGYEGLHYETVHTPHHVRKQAWWAYLAGGFHTYGHAMSHHAPPETWVQWIEAPGAAHMGACRRILTGLREWWNLVPDQSLFLQGVGKDLELKAAARCPSAGWTLAYFATASPAVLRMDQPAGGRGTNVTWIAPKNGHREPLGRIRAKEREFTPPAGWEDALLLLD